MIFNFRTLSTEQLEKLQREIEAELYERDFAQLADLERESKDEG